MIGYGNLKLVLDTVEQALSHGPYILGETFSAADILLASQIGFGLHFKNIEPRPGLAEYAARLWARPAAQRAAAIDGAFPPANG
jgi:glutathione S-transferase